MYHRNKVHTDEFWKYEMAKHRRTVVDDKDRNDDMWQQQLGRYGKDTPGKSSSSNDQMYGGEHQQRNNDPSHDERWLQQIQRATAKGLKTPPNQHNLTDAKLLALQSSFNSINRSMITDETKTDDVGSNSSFFCQQKFPSQQIQKIDIKSETIDENIAHPYTPSPNNVKDQIAVENGDSDTINKNTQQQDDTYLTLLAHLSAQRKACEEDKSLNSSNFTKEAGIPEEKGESIISREKSLNQYHQVSQESESLCSQQQRQCRNNSTPVSVLRDVEQDQRHSSKSPPTLSLPDIKEECSVTRTKMWLAQLGQYRQKAVQDEMEKSHDELWEEQISRIKNNPVKSPIEPLEITIEDEGNNLKARDVNKKLFSCSQKLKDPPKYNVDESSLSTDNSSSSMSIPPLFISKKGKTIPLISALQVQPAPTRAFKMISNHNGAPIPYDAPQKNLHKSCDELSLNSYSKDSLDLIRDKRNGPPGSFRNTDDNITPPPLAISPIASKGHLKEQISFKNLLSINPSTIVNINGQNVKLRRSVETNNQESPQKPLSPTRYKERISVSTPIESNNNGPPSHPEEEEHPNLDGTATRARHIPLAIPPLQSTSNLLPTAKYKNEKINSGSQLNGKVDSKESSPIKKDDNTKSTKPKYPPPDPNQFGSSSVLKMLLLDPNTRKRPASPLSTSIQNKRSTYSPPNKPADVQENDSNSDKQKECPNTFNRFSGAPNTSDETDILRRRLLGITKSPTPPSMPSKSVHMLLPKPRYSPPSATITSADIAEKVPSSLQRKSPMGVEEFSKVAAAAATLASFNMTQIEDKQVSKQNTEPLKMINKVNFPIEVNYENYYQDNSKFVPKSHKQQLLPTQQHMESMYFEYDDLENREKDMPTMNELDQLNHKYHGKGLVGREQNNNDNNNVRSPHKNGQCADNMSAYSRTSVSKRLLYRYTANNNNNNSISRANHEMETEGSTYSPQSHQ